MARYALVIGIAKYDNFSNLPKAAIDAEAIAQRLEQHHYNVTRLPRKLVAENQWAINPDKKLTGADLSTELKTFLRERVAKQEVVIYLAGHGFRVVNPVTDEQEGYLATSDCTKDGRNAIRFENLNTLIHRSDLSSLVMLLDCCYSGSLLDEQRKLLQSTQTTISQKQNYCLIAACRDFERAREGQEHGIFTAAVLEGLTAEKAVKGEITSNDLFGFVSRELKTSGQEVIHAGMGFAIPLVSYPSQERTISPKLDESVVPYRGLEPFEKEQAEFFFGRKQVIEDIWRTLDHGNFVAVIGASGSGKSSVVRAGLVPWLEVGDWQVLKPMKPGTSPLAKLATNFEYLFPSNRQQKQLNEFIYSDLEGLRQLVKQVPGSARLLLVVDQFEEIFTLSRVEERQRFVDLLTQVTEEPYPRLAIVITMRADFLEPCLQYLKLARLIQTQAIFMPPLVGADLEQAIAEPAKLMGYSFESGLLGEVLQDLGQEQGCLPLLQFALLELWEKRDQKKHQMNRLAYQEMGGVLGALERHAEKIYQQLSHREKDSAKQLCLKLLRTGVEMKDTRQRQPKQKLLELAANDLEQQQTFAATLQELIDGRLLVAGEENGEIWIDLAHEALMESWQRFKDWRQDNRDLRWLVSRIEDNFKDWKNHDCNTEFLISGGLLTQVHRRQSTLMFYLNSEEQEFYRLSCEQEHQKRSYEQEINQVKQQIQDVKMKLIDRIQSANNASSINDSSETDTSISNLLEVLPDVENRSSEHIEESTLTQLNQDIEGFADELQLFEQQIQLSRIAAEWLIDNQQIILDLSAEKISEEDKNLIQIENYSDSIEMRNYISWLYDSLLYGKPLDVIFEVPEEPIKTIYIEIFESFKQELLSTSASDNTIDYLTLYIDFLVGYLRDSS
jgi:hypothetical protein